MSQITRIYVEKKQGCDVEARHLLQDLREHLSMKALQNVRIINRYEVSGLPEKSIKDCCDIVFSEPPVDNVYMDMFPVEEGELCFGAEYLPGQFDQRADSASQCIMLVADNADVRVKTARIIILAGNVDEESFQKIKDYYINPVEMREAAIKVSDNEFWELTPEPAPVCLVDGFNDLDDNALLQMLSSMGLAMRKEDLVVCQKYFRDVEKRLPTETELRVLDTYWSDHCRHTTFRAHLKKVEIEEDQYLGKCSEVFQYIQSRLKGKNKKDFCLMDIATLQMKEMLRKNKLKDLDISEEINACSINVKVDVDGDNEDWLLMFKNETHNHPTEIEPFGGAATCLGGAIRDPLSGRSYVYQAMRVTGSGDPRAKISTTISGKLPQRKITTQAAAGYSSYGNQIGIATGQVSELYHPGYVAKRMEVGAVIGAVKKENVIREVPQPGDVVILLGGRTGRDGIGGATGSSKAHTEESLELSGAEVQKGNPPTERKLQRLFRRPEAVKLIKRCNDFGAGGVSVAIGELADSLDIELDAVPLKYDGLNGTELAISESQERMAVVVSSQDADAFIQLALLENIEATQVACVSDSGRLVMRWRKDKIVDIARDFLDSNGAGMEADAYIKAPNREPVYLTTINANILEKLPNINTAWLENLSDINVCSQKGLGERFDSTIGTGTILMPYGGKYQLAPEEGMAAKLPVLNGETDTASLMSFGCNPNIAEWSPFHGAVYAILEAVVKIVSMGGDYRKIRLSLQEYFEKLETDPVRWGKPLAALLGAFYMEKELGIPAIGGKDSMSGTFKDLNVPPTLVAFAVSTGKASKTVSVSFKKIGSKVVYLPMEYDEELLPRMDLAKVLYARIRKLASSGTILAMSSIRQGGLAAAVSRMCLGNKIAIEFEHVSNAQELFLPRIGSLILEVSADADLEGLFGGSRYIYLGRTTANASVTLNGQEINLADIMTSWEKPLSEVFPCSLPPDKKKKLPEISYQEKFHRSGRIKHVHPRVLIPVFPGTNCEYDSARAFEKAGAIVETPVIRNRTLADIHASVEMIAEKLGNTQILMLPGGFSAGDEPDGSGKFIAAFFRNEKLVEAISNLLENQDGLILGICNGFQALVKLGLLPWGRITEIGSENPTLTYNNIGRHVSRMTETIVSSNLSPWLYGCEVGDRHIIPVSHGEGRFICQDADLKKMIANGQIATRYVDTVGRPTLDYPYNPNGSIAAIEGITSPDGRIYGKMGHSERIGNNIAGNIPGAKDQKLFASGVAYFL